MDWLSSLPPDVQIYLWGAAADFTGGLLSTFVSSLLQAGGTKVRQAFQTPERTQALQRATGEAMAYALARYGITNSKDYQTHWRDWLFSPAVIAEFNRLLMPRSENEPDYELLRDEFEVAGFDPETVDPSFEQMIADMVGIFYLAAKDEPLLQEPIQIVLLEKTTRKLGSLERLAQLQLDVSHQEADLLTQIESGMQKLVSGQGDVRDLLDKIKQLLEQAENQEHVAQQMAYRAASQAVEQVRGFDGNTSGELARITILLEQLGTALGTKPLSEAQLVDLERLYCETVVDQYQTLTFKGIAPSGTPIALPLAEVYVELKAVADIPEAADTYSAEERRLLQEAEAVGDRHEVMHGLDSLRAQRWNETMRREGQNQTLQRRSIQETLADPQQKGVVILGDPGSGKTTLLHYLALRAAQGKLAGEGERLPIFVSLAAYDDHLRRVKDDVPLGDFLSIYYERWFNLPGLASLFSAALQTGQALVLFDGLDEVLDIGTRLFVAGQVESLLKQWTARGNRFALTSRIVGYREAGLGMAVPHVTVLEFGPAEIALFAHQWCLTYERWLAEGKDSPMVRQRATQEEKALLDDIGNTAGIERLAGSPLLLTMLALLRRHVGKLPDRRVELYERYVRTLIDNWELTRSAGARQLAPTRFDPHTAIAHLIELAYWLQTHKPSGTASRHELKAALTSICLHFEGYEPDQANAKARVEAEQNAERFLQDMRHFAGLLAERGRDAFGFLHLTFQEYFAGRALARMSPEERWQQIKIHLHNPRWREPILLCAGQLGVIEQRRELVSALIEQILAAQSAHEEILHRDVFLAMAIVTDNVGSHPAILDQLLSRLSDLAQSTIRRVRRQAWQGAMNLLRLGHQAIWPVIQQGLQKRSQALLMLPEAPPFIGDQACVDLRQAVLQALNDSDWQVRSAAVSALSKVVGSDEAVWQAVLQALNDNDNNVRSAAVSALSGLVASDEPVRQVVLQALNDSDWQVRSAAVSALSGLVASDEPVRQVVLQALNDSDWQVRRAAVSALRGLVASDEPVRQVVLQALNDSDEDVRSAAVSALSGLVVSDEAVRQAVLQALNDSFYDVRRAAVSALSGLVGRDEPVRQAVLQALNDKSSAVHSAAVSALSGLVASVESVRQVVLQALNDSDEDVRSAAVSALGGLVGSDEPVRQAVLQALNDNFYDVRSAAVSALSGLVASDETVRQVVLQALNDNDWQVRSAAVSALCGLVASDEPVRQVVLQALNDSDWQVRSAAVSALSGLVASDEPVRQVVLQALNDSFYDVRRAAVSALSGLVASDEPVRQAVLQALNDSFYDVRRAAVSALSGLVASDEPVRQAALQALNDSFYDVRRAAVSALSGLVGSDKPVRQAVLQALNDSDEDVRSAAVLALSGLVASDEPVRQVVLQALNDSDWQVRSAAVSALSGLVGSDKPVRQAALQALNDSDEDVRRAAVSALSGLVASDEPVRQAVLQALNDSFYNVRRAAVSALSGLVASDEPVRQAALQALNDSDWQVRAQAVLTLLPITDQTQKLTQPLIRWLGAQTERSYLQPNDETVRHELALWLGPQLVSNKQLFDQMIQMLDDVPWPVRHGAVLALLAMPGGLPEAVMSKIRGLLTDMRGEESWPNRLQVAEILINNRDRELDRRAITVAVEALDFATQPWYDLPYLGPEVRSQAARLLGQLDPVYQDELIFKRLARVLAEDPEEGVRDAAYEALLRLAAAPPARSPV